MKKITCILLTFVIAGRLLCQNNGDPIRTAAIECKDWSSANQKIYEVLKEYKFICLGEMHGTKEPAEFLIGLARTFISNNRRVIIGIEIPNKLMTQFLHQRDSVGLAKTNFFSGKSADGRASGAWFRAINECNKLGVEFCFFDNSEDNRDLGMCKRLVDCYRADTTAVILSLSGNIHNRIVPYKDSNTMGCCLKEYFGGEVCSINHVYNGGTMYSQTSDGLKVHTIEPTNNIFSTSTDYNSYYLHNIFNITEYSGFFYTTTTTASLPYKK